MRETDKELDQKIPISEFLTKLMLHLKERIAEAITSTQNTHIKNTYLKFNWSDLEALPIEQKLTSYFAYAATKNCRFLLALDNVDKYHYDFSKHCFFDEASDRLVQTVRDRIGAVITLFTKDDGIGNAAIAVVFACRDYVYEHCRTELSAELPKSSTASGTAYLLRTASDDQVVVQSRFALLTQALKLYVSTNTSAKNLWASVDVYKNLLIGDGNSRSRSLEKVMDIAHQGKRSVVTFLNQLRISPSQDREAFTRLFDSDRAHTHHMALMYMTDNKARFSHANHHFPNLFLVDAVIDPHQNFPSSHNPHQHTYWLKYLILRYIYINTKAETRDGYIGRVTVEKVLNAFGGIDAYSPNLVKLVLGSLADISHSACLKLEFPDKNPAHRTLSLTNRGRNLISGTGDATSKPDAAYCFSFDYLQLIVGDHYLSLPVDSFDKVFSNESLAYLLKNQREYGQGSWSYLSKKAPAVLHFLRCLQVTIELEVKRLNANKPSLIPLFPNINLVAKSVLETYKRLFQSTPHAYFSDDMQVMWDYLSTESVISDNLKRAYAERTLVSVG